MLADTEHLAELIDSKHDCLLQLRDLGRLQAALINSGDMSELLRMFAGKQRLIERLNQLERGLDSFRDQSPDARVWRTSAARERCAGLIEQSQRLLDEILELEKQNESQLKLKRDAAALKLQNLQVSNQARQAYSASQSECLRGVDLSF